MKRKVLLFFVFLTIIHFISAQRTYTPTAEQGTEKTTGTAVNAGIDLKNGNKIPENAVKAKKYYRSKQSGNWNDISTWEYSNNSGASWTAASAFPVYDNSNKINISSGDTVTITEDLDIDQTTIDAGGTLILTDKRLYIRWGSGLDFLINGTFIDNATSGNGFSIDSWAYWKYGPNGVIIKTNTSDVTPYADNYKGGNGAKPATAKWIYRYTGSHVPLLADMIYPTLIIENSLSGHYDMPNAFSSSSTDYYAPRVNGDLDIGGSGPGTITVYTECVDDPMIFVEGDLIVRSGCTFSNQRASSSHFGKGVSVRGGDVIVNGILDFNHGTKGNLRLAASSPQTITGTGTINILKLRPVNGSKVTLDMANTVNASNELLVDNGTFEISPQSSLTTYDFFNKKGTSDALVLKSDASGTASFIFSVSENHSGGTTDAFATVERYVTNYGWHYMFPTLDAISTNNYTDGQGSGFQYLYSYNESVKDYWNSTTIYDGSGNQSSGGWTNEAGSSNLRTDKGYIYSTSQGSRTISQTGGELHYGDKNFTVYYHTHSGAIGNGCVSGWNNYDGWNLVGNPYAAAIDWNSVNKTNIETAVYYYDKTQKKYAYYISGGGTSQYDAIGISVNGGSRYIPSGQGFMVKAQSSAGSAGATFTLRNSDRVHSSQAYWKKNNKSEVIPDLIRLNIEKDGYTDETIIRTLPYKSGVTEEHDEKYDAYKLFAFDNSKPQIFSRTLANDNYFAVNSLPEFTENTIIPLGIYVGQAGEHTINLTENNFSDMHIWLEDRTQDINVNLLNNTSYTFNQSAEENNDRFYLYFNPNTAPFVNEQIPDQIIDINETYSYTIPENTFKDNDFEDVLTFSATLEDDSELPEWLTFNPETKQFSGTPDESQNLNIKVKAVDIFGKETFDVFNLKVNDALSVYNVSNEEVTVYPNPAYQKFTININGLRSNAKIKIIDITGKTLIVKNTNTGKTTVDMKNFNKGIYFIEVETETETIVKKAVLK